MKKLLIICLTTATLFVGCQNDDDASFVGVSDVNTKSNFNYETEPFELTPVFEAELNKANTYMVKNNASTFGGFTRLCKWGNFSPYGGIWYSIDKFTGSDGSSMLFFVKHQTYTASDGKSEIEIDRIISVELITSPFIGCP